MNNTNNIKKKIRAGIIGITGYSGLEVFKILERHPHITSIDLFSSSRAGEHISSSYPMYFDKDYILQEINFAYMEKNLDVLFIATPKGISTKLIEDLKDLDLKIIDLSGDLRLKDQQDIIKWYNIEKPSSQEIRSHIAYGICEFNEKQIATSKIVANTGCYALTSILCLSPLYVKNKHMENALIDKKHVIVDAKSGVSGAGKTPTNTTIYGNVNENFSIYKVSTHQHIPEIEQHLSIISNSEDYQYNQHVQDNKIPAITFAPHLVPMMKGIMVTCHVQLENDGISLEEIHRIYQDQYKNSPFVRIRPLGNFPQTKEVLNTNYCDISLNLDLRTNRLIIVGVIDNLIKGASGNAVQNMNIMFSLPQTSGLKHI